MHDQVKVVCRDRLLIFQMTDTVGFNLRFALQSPTTDNGRAALSVNTRHEPRNKQSGA